MYILECSDGTYYTGSTVDLEKRVWEHENFFGANYTKKKHPVKLVYSEEYARVDEAFYREKQVQGWSHAKKKALIEGEYNKLPELSRNYTEYPRVSSAVASTGSVTEPLVELVETSVEKAAGTVASPVTSTGSVTGSLVELVETSVEPTASITANGRLDTPPAVISGASDSRTTKASNGVKSYIDVQAAQFDRLTASLGDREENRSLSSDEVAYRNDRSVESSAERSE
ncbi:MAG: GIY-YIG nuclease family protein [Spirochaetota bacterium]